MDLLVSKITGRFSEISTRLWLIVLYSSNGTFVNRENIGRYGIHALQHGDEISLSKKGMHLKLILYVISYD